MCHKNIFTYVYSDGHKGEHVKHDLCDNSRQGQPCKLTKTFEHPVEYVRHGQSTSPGSTYTQFPPTPPLSSHSASDSEHSSKERSGVYVNGEKVIDLNRRSSRRDKGDRTVYVEGSSLSRTPPRRYSVSHSTASSPREESILVREPRRRARTPESRERSTSSHYRAPVIEVKVVNNDDRHSNSSHRRHGSSKSSSNSGDDEERRRRRRDSHVRFEDDDQKEVERRKKIQSEIERQNADIANRPALPSKSASSNARYRRPSVVVDRTPPEARLISPMERLAIERERDMKAAEQRARQEEEAQRRRLKERMAPKPPTAVTHNRGRPRVYDEGYYLE